MDKIEILNKVPEPNFERNRLNQDIYIDKTKHIYNLLKDGGSYFLSRPRRFGKTMLIETMTALLENKKELFKNTFIYDKWDWEEQPTVYLDFGGNNKNLNREIFPEEELMRAFNFYKNKYNLNINVDSTNSFGTKFFDLVFEIYEKTGKPVTLLVDEYDKPLLDSISKGKFQETKEFMKDFYIYFKKLANRGIVRNTFITGVGRFSKDGIFSGLNHLEDISKSSKYADICGLTKDEILSTFDIDDKEWKDIEYWYNGYSFDYDGNIKVINPFSFFNYKIDNKFNNFWWNSGTPTFLMDFIKYTNIDVFNSINKTISSPYKMEIISSYIDSLEYKDTDLFIKLLYQTGYLTIKNVQNESNECVNLLDFPNEEVKQSYINFLRMVILKKEFNEIDKYEDKLIENLKSKNIKGIINSIIELFSSNNITNQKSRLILNHEVYYQNILKVFLMQSFREFEVHKEVVSDDGRIDLLLTSKDKKTAYIFEIKTNKNAENVNVGIEQIINNKYYNSVKSYDSINFISALFSSYIGQLTDYKAIIDFSSKNQLIEQNSFYTDDEKQQHKIKHDKNFKKNKEESEKLERLEAERQRLEDEKKLEQEKLEAERQRLENAKKILQMQKEREEIEKQLKTQKRKR